MVLMALGPPSCPELSDSRLKRAPAQARRAGRACISDTRFLKGVAWAVQGLSPNSLNCRGTLHNRLLPPAFGREGGARPETPKPRTLQRPPSETQFLLSSSFQRK